MRWEFNHGAAMTEHGDAIDSTEVRDAWDRAADAYAAGQASGRDYYRYEFFGPAQVAVCGDVAGRRLLDVGCGAGYFAREMALRGARVTGVDLSPRMLEHARRHEAAAPLGIDYREVDAEALDAAFAEPFDVVTSCLVLQDVPRPEAALRAIHAVLRPGGRAVLSMAHPCTDTPFREWLRDDAGRKQALAVDRYFARTVLRTDWRGWAYDFTTAAVHATLEDWFRWVLGTGFTLRGFHEPRPTEAAVRARPDLEDAARVPYFMILDLAR
jgi:2-polyprenyl-3-methyl-5-hydroxy-6-metoxy-1,4-benzoquinol methylase